MTASEHSGVGLSRTSDITAPAVELTGEANLLFFRVAGDIDAVTSLALESQLAARIETPANGTMDVIVDLRNVTLMSARGIKALARVADRLLTTGRRLLLVTGTGSILHTLRAAHAADIHEIFPSADAAISSLISAHHTAAPAAAPSADDGAERGRLRSQLQDLRNKLRSRPPVAHATGMLQERYHLADMGTANALLRATSQQHNLKMRALAAAFSAATPPSSLDSPQWFPGRIRPSAPQITFAAQPPVDRTTLLDLVLDATSTLMSTPMVDIQLVDTVRGGLTLE